MFGFIFGIIFIIVGIVVGAILINKVEVEYDYDRRTGDKKETKSKPYQMLGRILMVVLITFGFVAIVLSCIASVSTGHTGVVTTFGRVEDYTFDAGVHAKAPWNKVIEMDNRVQKATIELSCFSSDIQEVNCRYTLNYQISKANAQDIYRTVGKDYFDTVITPNVAESVKTIMAHYTAENLVGNRDTLATEIEKILTASLASYNIEVVSTAIEDIDFTDSFTNAVEAKQVAVQNKLKATTEQEQATMEAQKAAERAVIDAQAAAEVAKIQAETDLEVQKINADAAEYVGQKEAAKNEAIARSLNDALLDYYQIMQWNGKYPDTFVGEAAGTILDIK